MDNKCEIIKLIKCNDYLSKYGIILREDDVKLILANEEDALIKSDRIELGESISYKMIEAFCDSVYASNENFVDTIGELTEIFYHYKNETKDLVSDDELIKFMRKYFEEAAAGDIEYLANTIMPNTVNNLFAKGKLVYDIESEDDMEEEADEY